MLNRKSQSGATLLIALGVVVVVGILAGSIMSNSQFGWQIAGIKRDHSVRGIPAMEVGDSLLNYVDLEARTEKIDWTRVRRIIVNGANYEPDDANFGVTFSPVTVNGRQITRRGYYRGLVGSGYGCFGLDATSFECHLIEVVTSDGRLEIRQGFTVPTKRAL